METYEVLKGLFELIDSQADTLTMRLPVATVVESNYNYHCLNLHLKDGSKFSVFVVRMKDEARV